MKKEAKYFEVAKCKTNRLKVKYISTTAGGTIKKPHINNYSIFIETESKNKQVEKTYCINLNEKQFFNLLADLVDLYDCRHKKPLKLKKIYRFLEKCRKKTDRELKKLGDK